MNRFAAPWSFDRVPFMLEGNSLLAVVGIVLGLVLLGIGWMLGFRLGRRGRAADVMSETERERMLRLLHELGTWTSEYSGNVSKYSGQLGELSEAVRANGEVGGGAKVITLLQQIMQTNEDLQQRLDAAERQLDKQTRQIESYLTEARTDGLTGLYNRRAFDQKMDELFTSYRKGGRSFVLTLIDIDHFKRINDTQGHQAGDQVLQRIASILNNELDDVVIVARFGGEEFAAIMDGPLRLAAERMNSVRKRIAGERFDVGAVQLEVTISVGLSEPREDTIVAPIIRRADESLYAAKNMGRNRVYFHDGRGPALVGAPEVLS
ncbi:MAG: GGDEF domain-containing protein [Planctomycetota bacterium]